MVTISVIAVVALVGVLFALMAVTPMMVEATQPQPKRSQHLRLVHWSDATSVDGYREHVA